MPEYIAEPTRQYLLGMIELAAKREFNVFKENPGSKYASRYLERHFAFVEVYLWLHPEARGFYD